MTVAIVEVANNTAYTLSYENQESGYKVDIKSKTDWGADSDNVVPASSFKDDFVPFRSNNKYIIITTSCENGPTIKISDDDWQFSVISPYPYSGDETERKYGKLERGGKYVLRVDEKYDGKTRTCALSFLVYNSDLDTRPSVHGFYILIEALSKGISIAANIMGGTFGKFI